MSQWLFFFFFFFTRLSSHTCGQKMAAEAAAGRCRCPQREPRELLAMKMNVWEQIRLFLGDLSLALYERESGWVWRLWRESERKQTQQEGRWRRKAAVVFFGEEGEKKNRLGGRTNDQVVTDMKTLHLSVGVEWKVQRMIWPIWSFWVTTDQGRRLCGDVVMSLAVEDPRGTPSLLNQTHTHTSPRSQKALSGLGGVMSGKSESGCTPFLWKWANGSQRGGNDQSGQGGRATLGRSQAQKEVLLAQIITSFW